MAKKKLTNKARQNLMLWVWNNSREKKPVAVSLAPFESVELEEDLFMPQVNEFIRRKQLLAQDATPAKRAYTKKEDSTPSKKEDKDSEA